VSDLPLQQVSQQVQSIIGAGVVSSYVPQAASIMSQSQYVESAGFRAQLLLQQLRSTLQDSADLEEEDDDTPTNQIPAAALEAYVAQMASQNQNLPIIGDLMTALNAMRQAGDLQVPQQPPQQQQQGHQEEQQQK
jgi:hypothetical protein